MNIAATTPPPLPNTVFLCHAQARAISGNAIIAALNGNQELNGTWIQSSPMANGDIFEYQFALKPGTYTIRLLGQKRSLSGIVDWTLDGAAVATDDFYDASAINNNLWTHTGVVVTATADGIHTLRGTVNGKNASSTGYRVDIGYITLIEE